MQFVAAKDLSFGPVHTSNNQPFLCQYPVFHSWNSPLHFRAQILCHTQIQPPTASNTPLYNEHTSFNPGPTLTLHWLCIFLTESPILPKINSGSIPPLQLPLCIKNVSSVHAWTGANGPQLLICHHALQSLNIAPSLLNTKSLNPGVQICFTMWSQGLSHWGEASLSLGVHLTPGLATVLKKL